MKRMHVHVSVDDLATSIGFYLTLFGERPVVVKDDYAKWMLDDPHVNFAISNRIKVRSQPRWHPGGNDRRAGGKVETCRRGDAGRGGDHLLLREIRQVLGQRPFRPALGDLPHDR